MDSVEQQRKAEEFWAKVKADEPMVHECANRVAEIMMEYKGKTLSRDLVFRGEVLIAIISNSMVYMSDEAVEIWMNALKMHTLDVMPKLREAYKNRAIEGAKQNVDKAHQ